MTKLRRIFNFIAGMIMIAAAMIMLLFPDDAYIFILLFLGISFLAAGAGTLSYYFSMARFMTGGKMILYKGSILLDFAVLSLSLTTVPKIYVLLYLASVHAFSGFVEIMRADETKQSGSKNYRMKLMHGIINILLAVCCIIFIKKTHTAVIIYCLGLIYSGIVRIITAFRRQVFVYIR
ncbi:MAG: DUF308 domain-containing protein [Lachnospiraceae bacterium]|nr:DUF308 domain-containing protein [Lachnospiraceae bacterium]